MNIKNSFLSVCITPLILLSQPASALNIVLTNDDSWNTNNIQAMKSALIEQGHDVIMSAPCTGQSGKGGAINFFKAVNVDTSQSANNEYCVGDTDTTQAFEDYTEGTPVMSVLYGIDVVAQERWGKNPDLVVSGPNEGNNLGYMNNNSGTLGATMIALSRNIPAIAVSGSENSAQDSEQGKKIAKVVIDVINNLEKTRIEGQPLLPAYTGLNINTPHDIDNNLGYLYTNVGWNAGGIELKFVSDLSNNEMIMDYVVNMLVEEQGMSEAQARIVAEAMLRDKHGISFMAGDAGDTDEMSKGVAVKSGYITISTIDGNVQATRAKAALIQQRLIDL
ncbi:acid phosphatase [Aliivibrio fischeri]|uniref:5'/3'-nucleotidase SurE n=1 Tax=Aliivibrio fischeri TaxID=668 RepID=UPI0012D91AB7|nr:5'/3'-nucleotidase SurE [Aliivibrio fischeri]MUK29014.1 acid phosphatase [Aliivibrio fischeri]